MNGRPAEKANRARFRFVIDDARPVSKRSYFPPPRCQPRPSEMLNDGTYRCVTLT